MAIQVIVESSTIHHNFDLVDLPSSPKVYAVVKKIVPRKGTIEIAGQ